MTDPATCQALEADFSALLDGELEPAREAEVRVHAAGCARCAERLARLARVDEALRALPEAETPGDLAERLRLRLEEERRRASTRSEDRGGSFLQGRSFQESRGRAGGRGQSSETRRPQGPDRRQPRRRRWIPLAALAVAAAVLYAVLEPARRPAPEEPRTADRERTAPEQVAVREVPPPLPREVVAGPELEAIQAASDEDLALALDLDTLADLDVIERLEVLEQLAALDGAR